MLVGVRFRAIAVHTVVLASLAKSSHGGQISQHGDPWTNAQLLSPKQLSELLSGSEGSRPAIIYVGFPVLYRGAHISGAVLAGPASKAEGLDKLKKLVRNWPKDRAIVLYCGCCPFVKCPNTRPAFRAFQEMGFDHLKVLIVETNLHTDWTLKGYPISKGENP